MAAHSYGVHRCGCTTRETSDVSISWSSYSLTPGGTILLSFSLSFQKSSDSNGPDYSSLDDLYWSQGSSSVTNLRRLVTDEDP